MPKLEHFIDLDFKVNKLSIFDTHILWRKTL